MISSDYLSLLFSATGDTSHARKEFTDLQKKISNALQQIDTEKLNKGFENIGNTISNVGNKIAGLGKTLTVAIAAPLAASALPTRAFKLGRTGGNV